MAIYGLNFNGSQIPAAWKRRFAQKVKSIVRGKWYDLKGICDSEEERDFMLVAINNGHRTIKVVPKGRLFGIYVLEA